MPPSPTLLIADDDAAIRTALEALFAAEPYRLVFAEDGAEALALAAEVFPDVILLDVMMPHVDGLEVCRRLRADPRLGAVPILLVTALADPASRLAGIEAGADDFLSKPFDHVEMLARVRAFLRFNRYRQLYEEHVRLEAERQEADAARRESEARWQALVSSSPDYIALHDQAGRFLFLNHYPEGFTEQEVIGSSVYQYLAPDSIEIFGKNTEAALASWTTQRFEYSGLGDSATSRSYEGYIIPMKGRNQDINILAVSRDITARKQAEAEIRQLNADLETRVRERTAQLETANAQLRAGEEKYRTVADFTYDWEYWRGPDGNYLYVSPACERITGHGPAEFQDDPALLEIIAHPADRAWLAECPYRPSDSRAPHTMDFRILARSGETRWIGHWCQSVHTAEGEYLGRRGSNRDITAQKRAEDALRQLTAELEQRVGERTGQLETTLAALRDSELQLRTLAAHLQQALEVERAAIAREIHDELGQALTGLHLDLSWLERRLPDLTSPLRQRVDAMNAQVDDLIRQVQRISSELRPPLLDELGLAAAFQWQTREFTRRTGVPCELNAPDHCACEPGRSMALFRILQEALTNVARHGAATQVTVTLACDAHTWRLEVADNGRGITAQELARPTALGLLGMQERVLPWNGAVDISGRPGQGTRVTALIPAEAEA